MERRRDWIIAVRLSCLVILLTALKIQTRQLLLRDIASGSPLGTRNVSATVPQKLVKGDLHIFRQNVAWLSLCWNNIFPFLYAEPFGYGNSPKENTVKFSAKFGAISPSPRKRGEDAKKPITGY